MHKILVLGITGFVGQHLLKHLKHHDATYLVRKTSDLSQLKNEKIVYGDITDLDSVILAAKGQEIIINLTAPNTQKYETNRRVIVDGTANILKAAQRNGVKKIIHLSSAAVYRKNLDSYGRAKKEAEELIFGSKCNVIMLRPTMIYGPKGYIFKKILASLTKIPFFVFVIGNGKNLIQPVHVDDVAHAVMASISLEIDGVQTFDLGGPRPIKYDDFIKKMLVALNKKKILVHVPVSFIIGLVKFLNLFFKNLSFNATTIKRMVEEIELDNQTTIKTLKIKITDYDEALRKSLAYNIALK